MGQINVTDNLFYDLVSIQYHALKGQEVYDKFLKDAGSNQEIAQFITQVKEQDVQRAQQCHRFLSQLSGGGTGEPYPTETGAGATTGAAAGTR